MLNPVEMAMTDGEDVAEVLKSIPGYVELFKKAFPKDKEAVTYDNLALAIGAFERQLVTPSRFDKYLAGDKGALTEQEKEGFTSSPSSAARPATSARPSAAGPYQKLGLVKPYPNQADLGRYEVTKNEADKMYFRVPTLRNVAKTGP